MDNFDWNRLVGKKVLFFHPENKQKITTMEVEGCDPGIGICIMDENRQPVLVMHGKLSPQNKASGTNGVPDTTLWYLYNQVRSGYVSVSDLFNYLDSVHEGYSTEQGQCPFSM